MPRQHVLALSFVAMVVVTALAVFALVGHLAPPAAEAATGRIGAKAFAAVSSNGNLLPGQNRNVQDVDRPQDGLYCLKLNPDAGTVKNIVVSLHAVSAARVVSGDLSAFNPPPLACPNGTDAFVITRDLQGQQANAPFYVLMH